MKVLGLEGTAHTISAGIVDDNRIISNFSSTYIPKNGGIHPREAAIHHADNILPVMKKAFEESGLSPGQINLVAFSMGPGLGPCLRVVATAARAFSIKYGIPLIGVNHPLGHVEIGRKLSGAKDPIMLYISGGNTQIIAHEENSYKVLGETMDIGLGNLLDKLARDVGIPFPGGPKIEEFALKGDKLLDLPYSVKGMDTSFSGIYTAARNYIGRESIENICYSVQETTFSMLVEVLERALYYTDKREILLAGGVARNDRLRSMVSHMAKSSGYVAYLTDKKYCMDNGAMIAQAGMLMYLSGQRQHIMDTKVNQSFRIDEVKVPWINSKKPVISNNRGAEALISESQFYGRKTITKQRVEKEYRNQDLDRKIRTERMKNEFNLIFRLRSNGINSPILYDFDKYNFTLVMQKIEGVTLNKLIREGDNYNAAINKLGQIIGEMHNLLISHGDLNPNNIMVVGPDIYLIDPSMGKFNCEIEDMADDIFLLTESFKNLYSNHDVLENNFISSYKEKSTNYVEIIKTLDEIKQRRRYV
ncbi:bifunctional N(6)-L-threonylcarbamoyladenine synthase/serine/threonine protein kinase [Ferroplasma acidiphilum]|uniref:Probable bifunctional tRNA threonylcarbamoyladenosine biosynthesis protein n=1 Tax=Ferroplasma acidiphilum TaxID=74969 RepID=A0A7K4FLA1_9ARCH|nr:bifunctional N(6)-L-threonylcarbamoyladenine synthase/serine/threonine protein kinase [Ferroplasma acidiphilum]NOL59786.1 bifunctional N(6)-L-threonylcarbamoyladenine synthase/serine/threonine protein kinase [Ferroplasma acidiphilum]